MMIRRCLMSSAFAAIAGIAATASAQVRVAGIETPNFLSGIQIEGFGDLQKAEVGSAPEFLKLTPQRSVKNLMGVNLHAHQLQRAQLLSKVQKAGVPFASHFEHLGTLQPGRYQLVKISASAAWNNRVGIVPVSDGPALAVVYDRDGPQTAEFTIREPTKIRVVFETSGWDGRNWWRVFATISGNEQSAFFGVEDGFDTDYNDLVVAFKRTGESPETPRQYKRDAKLAD